MDDRIAADRRAVRAERTTRVATALTGLTAAQREAIRLRYWEELTLAQAAARLGCSVGSVDALVSRGLANMRARLGASAA